jgi:hypothetical protein
MSAFFTKQIRSALLGFFALILASCGGGGGSSGPVPTPLPSVTAGIEVTPTSVELSAIKDIDTSGAQKTLTIQIIKPEVAFVAAGYPPGVADATWLRTTPLIGTPPVFILGLSVDDPNLDAGTYSTTIRIATADKDQKLLGYVDVPVKYTLTKQLAALQKEITFDYVLGSPNAPYAQGLDLYGKGIAWTAKASEPWVTLNLTSGTAPSQIAVGFNPSGLSQGSYSATVTFTPTDGSPPFVLKVSLNVRASTLNASAYGGLNFTSILGGVQNTNSAVSLNTTGSPLTWTAKADQPWISLSPASGTATSAYSYPASSVINVAVNSAGLGVGQYNGVIKITDQNGGEQIQPVTFVIRSPELVNNYYSPLSFESVVGGPSPAPASIPIASDGNPINWTAATNQSWIKLGTTSGTTPTQLSVAVDPAGLTQGSYSGAITVSNQNGGAISIQVGYTIKAPALLVGPQYYGNQLNFYGVNGATFPPQNLDVKTNNGRPATWTAVSNAAWLKINKSAGSTPDVIEVSVDPTSVSLPSGEYTSSITLSGVIDGQAASAVVNVTLSLRKPFVTVTPAQITLGGPAGHDRTPQPIYLGAEIGKAVNWKVVASDAWIKPDKTTFAGGQNLYGDPPALSVSADAGALAKGKYTGRLTFTATVNGDTLVQEVPVSISIDSHRIQVAENGVALTKTPGLSQLSRSVKIMENFGGIAKWAASSDQAWLSVTASGTTADAILMTANAAGLAQDQIHYATVSVSSPDALIENAEKIRVGFWVGSTALASTMQINSAFTEIEADPVRPYVYAHNGVSDISVFHNYTGAEIAKIKSVAPLLGDMQVSSDGATLYVVDKTNLQIVPINLETQTSAAGWPLGPSVSYQVIERRLEFVRVNGLGVVIAGDGLAYNAQSGAKLLQTAGGWSGHNLAIARDVSVLYSGSPDYPFDAIVRTVFDYDYTNNIFYANRSATAGYVSNNISLDLAARPDGSKLYYAGQFSVGFLQFNGIDLSSAGSLPSDGPTRNIMVAQDGRVYGSAYSPGFPKDVWVYDTKGFAVTSLRIAGPTKSVLSRQLIQSGDGLLLIALTDDPTLQIIPINF